MISNATAIICLSKINKLDLIKKLFSKVIIPSAVKEEILVEGKEGLENIKNAIEEGWIKILEPKRIIDLGLGKGENEAISLAQEKNETIMLDDACAIKAAKSLEVQYIRSTTVILLAYKKKIINKKETIEILNQLIENGYYISTKYYSMLLSKIK